MALHVISGLLLVADVLTVLGRATQRLLADVYSPRGNYLTAVLQLGLQSTQSRYYSAFTARLFRRILGCSESGEVRELSAVVRRHIRSFYSSVDRYKTYYISVLHYLEVSSVNLFNIISHF